MCAICGKIDFNGAPVGVKGLWRMLNALHHRGPDDEGVYQSGSIGLAHKRLKIIDLATGKQPMSNEDGTVWVVYNGEIYNYRQLTDNLVQKGHRFTTATDTEVIVHLYEELGEQCVAQLQGMFSFALWDEKTKTLLLARDRVGIKPLYYCRTPRSLIFASEIKAILTDPSVEAEIDPALLDRYLAYFYLPGDQTLFKNISKLEPGHYMTVRDGAVAVRQYWNLAFDKRARSFDDAVEELEQLLSQTVRDHMISDVPIGVLLSGGLDSSGVLSFAAENTSHPISTFTVGFEGECSDERPYARLAAKAFGARNYEISISPQDFWGFLPKYVWHMEEPVCEPPAIALYYVSKFAREYVTVLLSGEGGDEAFAGYQSYRNVVRLERLKHWLGPFAGPVASLIPGRTSASGASRSGKCSLLMRTPLAKYYYSHSSTPYTFFNQNYRGLYTSDFLAMLNDSSRTEASEGRFAEVQELNPLDQMLYVDTKTWLPDDLLIKADKMTMANSLELRVPLLDHQVLEFAASLPCTYKLKGTNTKRILKRALAKRLPPEILKRKKAGFPVPYGSWLRNELRHEVRDVLLDKSTIERGYFRKDAVEQMINEASGGSLSKELFSLVTLEYWHRTFLETNVGCPC